MHPVPSGCDGFEQTPSAGSQTPATWHWSSGVQTTGLAPVQVPAWQVSVCVQALPSVHPVPSGWDGFEQTPSAGLQTPATWHWSSGVHTTGFAPVHVPAWQVSVCVQASPSVHPVPLGWDGFEQTPSAGLQTPATWHWSSGVHTTGFAPVQVPAWQVSVCVQASPSVHPVPSGWDGFEQMPSAGLQTPATWHWSSGVQTTGLAPVQVPAWQVSVCVQASPSVHPVPSGCDGFEQTPSAGLQTPATWHWSSGVHTTGFAPVQVPAWQVSVCVQASPSVHPVPSGWDGFEQTPSAGLQTPATWHWSSGVQTTGLAPVQVPAWQVSVCVQASPSVHPVPSGWDGFEQMPSAGLQTPATWHWSSGVHTTGFAPVQVPAWQVSVCVQASPSVHPVPSGWDGFEQMPSAGLQTPATWHWSSGVHTTGFAPVQVPAWQVSVCVQASPSVQPVPSGWDGFEQMPSAGLQTPATWHWSSGVQTTGLAPVQVPAWQVSVCVQASPSVHPVPSGWDGFEQMPSAGLQTPATWHWSSGVQTTGLAPVHVPAWQVSVCVQASPSVHPVPSGWDGFEQMPSAGLQTPATWHWSSGVHTTGLAPVQVPAWQVSVCVQASPSVHPVPSGALT